MILKDIPFTIPKEAVLLRLNYNLKKTVLTDAVDKLIDEMITEGMVLAERVASIEEYEIQAIADGVVTLGDTDFVLKGQSLSKHLGGCHKVSLFLCTIGMQMGERLKELIVRKDLTKASILDAVGSEAVEALADAVNMIIRDHAAREKATVVRRFSPGYGDWPIAEQKALLQVLKAEEIGVSLTESALMIPEKSVTAVVGWKRR